LLLKNVALASLYAANDFILHPAAAPSDREGGFRIFQRAAVRIAKNKNVINPR
jgi:hypothetical protein